MSCHCLFLISFFQCLGKAVLRDCGLSWENSFTIDSRYLEIQENLWKTSRYPYFDISDLRNLGKQLIEQPPLREWVCNLTPKLDILKILWKRGEIATIFSAIFCCLLVDLCDKTGTRFSLRDKRLFEISGVEIPRVDCIFSFDWDAITCSTMPFLSVVYTIGLF